MMGNDALGQPLDTFLGSGDLDLAMRAIAGAARPIAARVALGGNSPGDLQKSADIFADQQFEFALRSAGVRAIVSEPRATPTLVDPDGKYLVALDPLDAAANVDINVTIGSIVSVLEAPSRSGVEVADFLQPGHRQRAAALVVYGPQVGFVFTTGAGAHAATLDPEIGVFRMTHFDIQIPEGRAEFAIDASNARHWPEPIRSYVEDCVMGETGPRAKDFSMRWLASLVADAYRVLMRGGACLYPDDARAGHRNGRLRLVFQANPIALLIEQAGGMATDGANRILDIRPAELHARTALMFGSTDKIERIRGYFVGDHRSASRAPLFGKRGLLRG